MPQTQPSRSFAELSLDTKVLAERLAELQPDEVVSYQELSDLIGRAVNGGTSNLGSARRFVQREYGIVTDVVRGQGIKRLTAPGIVATQQPARAAIRRRLRRTIKKIHLADDERLTREERQEKYSFIALGGTLQHFLKPATAQAVKAEIGEGQTIAVGKVLEILTKKAS